MNSIIIFAAIAVFILIDTSWSYIPGAVDSPSSKSNRNNDERIVGGKTVDITLHPHQVSMRLKNLLYPTNSYAHNCGGSIYSKDIIITAAHCVIARVPSEYQIAAGANQRRSSDGIVVPVREIIMHEEYVPSSYNNDIAIVVLASPLPINNLTIKPVQLVEEGPLPGAIATVTGWGATSSGGYAANLLQEVQVPIVSNELCNLDYSGRITDSMLCAGIRGVGGKDSCQGDSGGPLLIKGKLAGVVSWGYYCADSRYPGVYANVWKLLPWLRENIAAVETRLLL